MKSILKILTLLCLCYSCSNDNPTKPNSAEAPRLEKMQPLRVSALGKNAAGPYFTTNHKGNSVLVWTEELPNTKSAGNVIKFATLNDKGDAFGKTYEVTTSKGCRSHDESMNKIAFKDDGTIVAVFSKRTPTKKNRFAGALYYTQSFDGGKEWTPANYLHVGDTTHGLSRSFFDLATLPDGEVGAIWLDSRLTEKRGDGSSLFFAKTKAKDGFVNDQVIGRNTCECCRTDIFVSSDKNIHVIYRDIWQDTIRDMSHLVSTDNGLNFSQPKRISEDNWAVNGCPHTGPSMGETSQALHYAWYTMGGGAGIYYTASEDSGKTFKPRKLLSEYGKHPQLLAMQDEKVVFVWEELELKARQKTPALHEHGSHHQTTAKKISTSSSKTSSFIKAQVWQNGAPLLEHWVSQPGAFAEYPVATELANNQIGIAWVQEDENEVYQIYFRKL